MAPCGSVTGTREWKVVPTVSLVTFGRFGDHRAGSGDAVGDGPSREAEVTVVVLAHRQAAELHRCLSALRSHVAQTPFDVVVVANGASAKVLETLANHDWVTTVRSESNRGFAGGANLGASLATGRWIAFLNDDAVVTDGWLDGLVGVLERDPSVGLVGSVIVDDGGSILEFGSGLDDLAPHALERGADVAALASAVPRDVAFVSACSVVVASELFGLVGRFDEDFYPAYFEDVDLCLRVWEAGRRVVVTPASVVVHSESSSTTSVQRQVLFDEGRRTFDAKWGGRPLPLPDVLPRSHPPVVVFDDYVPEVAAGSGMARARQMVDAISRTGRPVLLSPSVPTFELDRGLAAQGVRLLGGVNPWPLDVEPSCVVASRPTNFERAHDFAMRHDVPLIYDAEARYSARLEAQLELGLGGADENNVRRDLDQMLRLESWAAQRAEAIVTISASEAAWFAERGARDVRVIDPFPARCAVGDAPFAERADALFIAGWMGGRHSPNGDGLHWMITEVLPILSERQPGVRVLVTGESPPVELVRISPPNLRWVGALPDLGDALDRVRLTISPIRFGAGIKLKVVDSLARAVPVVATTVGAEGLEAKWNCGVRVTNDAEVFAQSIADLATDVDAWTAVRRELEAVCAAHTSDAVRDWRQVLAAVGAQDVRPSTGDPVDGWGSVYP